MSYGLIAVIIVIGIVIGVIATKKCEPFLRRFNYRAIFLYKQDFITEWLIHFEGVMSDEAYLILVCGLFGSIMLIFLQPLRDILDLQRLFPKICNSEKKDFIHNIYIRCNYIY